MLAIGNVPGSGNPMNTSTSQRAMATNNEQSWDTTSNITTYAWQHVPIKYIIAQKQHHMIPPIHNNPNEDYNSQQLQRMTSITKEEEEI